jgi:hypothetical protein
MAARIVYLDQNKWIELAQAVHGKGNAHLLPILEFVRQIKASGLAVFPLSLAHHIETSKRLDAGQQERLGRLMWEISDGRTFAAPDVILRSEIDSALVRTFQRTLRVRPLVLVGRGLSHAAGKRDFGFKMQDPDSVMPQDMRTEFEQFANRVLDYGVLTGTTPWGPAVRPRPDLSGPAKDFVADLTALRVKLADGSREIRRRTVYARLMLEVLEELLAALKLHGLTIDEFAALGPRVGYEGYIGFIDSLPSVRVRAHLYLQWLQNPQLPVRENDLNDWHFVGAAVAHADVVVTEKHLAHIVNAGNLEKKAIAISDLTALPSA